MLAPQLPALMPLLEKLQRQSTFTPPEIHALLALPVRHLSTDSGAHLLREGDIPQHCCLILSGSAFRHKVARNGARQILAVHFTGDLLFLDQSLLNTADYSVQSLSGTDVGFIPYQAILDLADEFPNIGRALWRDTFVEASVSREWIFNVGQRDARQRIAHVMCEVAIRQEGAALKNTRTIQWPLTQEQLGDATGLTAVHVNRTMQGLRSAGLIRTDKLMLTILDWTALQAAGDFNASYLHLPMARAA